VPLPAGPNGPETVFATPDGSVFVTITRPDALTHRPEVLIAKVDANGAATATFGDAGTLTVPAPSGSSRSGVLAMDAAGRLLLGFVDRGATLQPYLARLDGVTGALDTAFGRGGLVRVANLIVAIAPTGGGKLLTVSRVAQNGRFTLVLARRFN